MPKSPLVLLLRAVGTATSVALAALSTAQITSSGLFFDGDRVISESATSLALPKQISGGAGLMVLREDGSVFAVADQSRGWLAGFHVPKGLAPLTKISAGAQVSIGLKSDGTVVTWGDASYGIAPPVGLDHVVQVVSTGTSLAALKDDGKAVAWGDGQAVGPDLPLLKQVESLGKDLVGLTRAGKVIYLRDGSKPWRHDYHPNEGDPTPPDSLRSDFVQLGSGADELIAVRADGSAVIFGYDPRFDSTSNSGSHDAITTLANIKSISCNRNGIAVLANGTVFEAPFTGTYNSPWMPASERYGSDVVQVVTSDWTSDWDLATYLSGDTWVLRRDGTISGVGGTIRGLERLIQVEGYQYGDSYAWGEGYGLRDDGTVVAIPDGQPVAGASGVVSLSVGAGYAAGLRADGSVVTWGSYAQVPPAGIPPVAQVSASGSPLLTLLRDGSLLDWRTPSTGPKDLPPVQSIATGSEGLAAALLKTGQVRAWYRDGTPWFVPPGLAHVAKLQISDNLLIALQEDGHVVGWRQEIVDLGIPERVADIYAKGLTFMTMDFNGLWTVRRGSHVPLPPFPAVSVSGLTNPIVYDRYGHSVNRLYSVGLPEISVRFMAGTVSPSSSMDLEVFSTATSSKGIRVALTCFDPKVILPAHVTIPAGSHTLVVPVRFAAYTRPTPVTVSATLGTTTQFAQILVAHPFLVSVSEPLVVGGTDDRVSVTIRQRRAAANPGTRYAVRYPDGFLLGPKTVTIPSGQDSVQFEVSAQTVPTFKSCRVEVGPPAKFETVEIVDYPLEATSLVCDPTAVGGGKLHVAITLNAIVSSDTSILYESSNPKVIPSGAIVVPAHSSVGSMDIPVTSRQATEVVSLTTPTSPPLRAVVTVTGMWIRFTPGFAGGKTKGYVSFSGSHDDMLIHLSSDAGVTIPETIVLPKNYGSVGFSCTTRRDATGNLTVSADYPGMSATLSLPYQVSQMSSLAVRPLKFVGGSDTVVKLTALIVRDPFHDSVITLLSSRPDLVAVPATLKLDAKLDKLSLNLQHFVLSGSSSVKVTITATLNGSSAKVELVVVPK